MKTKSKDMIKLSDGQIMTLGEAFDRGLVRPIESTYYLPTRYFAREIDANVSWEIGKTFYESRIGIIPSVAKIR